MQLVGGVNELGNFVRVAQSSVQVVLEHAEVAG